MGQASHRRLSAASSAMVEVAQAFEEAYQHYLEVCGLMHRLPHGAIEDLRSHQVALLHAHQFFVHKTRADGLAIDARAACADHARLMVAVDQLQVAGVSLSTQVGDVEREEAADQKLADIKARVIAVDARIGAIRSRCGGFSAKGSDYLDAAVDHIDGCLAWVLSARGDAAHLVHFGSVGVANEVEALAQTISAALEIMESKLKSVLNDSKLELQTLSERVEAAMRTMN